MGNSNALDHENAEAVEPEVMEDRDPKTAKSMRSIATIDAAPSSVAPWEPSALSLLSEEEFDRRLTLAKKERERIAAIQRSVMTEKVDYGTIPGTQKPTLYKPGAEILNRLAGLTPHFYSTREVGDGVTSPQIRYQVKCELVRSDGAVAATGEGSCNSWERKYRYRSSERVCPSCNRNTLFKSKREKEWFCWARKGGCGDTFPLDHPEIVGQGDVMENPDPYDLDNTILKMASKRAMLAATLLAHACSGIFTQDVLDGDEEEGVAPDPGNGKANGKGGAPLDQQDKNAIRMTAAKRAGALNDPSINGNTILVDLGLSTDKDLARHTKPELPRILDSLLKWEPGKGKPVSHGAPRQAELA